MFRIGWFFCNHCNLDKIAGFAIVASLGGVGMLTILFRFGSIGSMSGLLFVFTLAIGTVLLVAPHLQPRLTGETYDHYHATPYIARKLLPSAMYDHLKDKFEDFLAFMDIWRTVHVAGEKLPSRYRYTTPDLEFKPISFVATRVLLREGWLILRLQRYPNLFEWPRLAWLNKLYHTYRDYQRSVAAAQWAFDEMQGELDGAMYSISELEGREDAKSLVWLTVPPPW